MDAAEKYYIKKLESDGNVNMVLRYFTMPKYPIFFMFLMATSMSVVARQTNVWVPSIPTVLIVWNIWVALEEKERLICGCLGTEMLFQKEIESGIALGENYITEQDRESIVADQLNVWDKSLRTKLRRYYKDLVWITTAYTCVYLAIEHI